MKNLFLLIFIICIGFVPGCPGVHQRFVTFSVSGTASVANIEYSVDGKETVIENADIPWEKECLLIDQFSDEGETRDFNLLLSAEKITDDDSVIEMKIINSDSDYIYNSATFSGPFEKGVIRTKITVGI